MYTQEQVTAAAKFYLQTQGMTGTAKQIARLLATLPGDAIVRMAMQRGWAL